MASLRRAVIVAGVTGCLLYLFGFPGLIIFGICVAAFLSSGGLIYVQLFIKTFPRDVWMGYNLRKIILAIVMNKRRKRILSDLFEETVRQHPDKLAIVYVNEERVWTFRELDEYANRVANYYRNLGMQKGDSVAIFMENSPEYVGLCVGLWKIGVITAWINFNLRHESLAHCVSAAKANALIFSASLADAVAGAWGNLEPVLDVSSMCFTVCGDPEGVREAKRLDRELSSVSSGPPPALPNKSFEDRICYIYTSGTTGLPKACPISQTRLFSMQLAIRLFAQISSDDIVYNSLPLYHTNGGVLALGQMLFAGNTYVLRKKFSASNFFSDCVKHKCTVMFHIGELCRYLLAQPKKPTDVQHCIRLAIGNGLRLAIWKEFQKRFAIKRIVEFYGSTEGNVNVCNFQGKPGACGIISVILPAFNPLQLIKVDPDTGTHIRDANGFCVHADIDEPGEAVGFINMKFTTRRFDGYEDKSATAKKVLRNVFKPGDMYFLSGDILKKDEEGFLFFCDRTGDTFRWKGENVSTMEIEGVIHNLLSLRDAVVYGVEVPGMEGRAGMVAIVGTEKTVDLSHLLQQLSLSLPLYAVPIFVRLISVAETTGTHKLKKVELRKEGCNPNEISDTVFFLDPQQKAYVPFTGQLYQQVADGNIRL